MRGLCAVVFGAAALYLAAAGSAAAAAATLETAELEVLCKESLAGYKRPKRYVVLRELPKTATGKIQRYKLRT